MKWEYHIITLLAEVVGDREYGIGESHVQRLDALGAEGWELVSVLPSKYDDLLRDVTYVFKRSPKQSSILR